MQDQASQKKDPKNLLDDIAVVEVQYRCVLWKEKKAAVVVHTEKFYYAAVITVTGTTIRASMAQGATMEELVAEMHKQYCILVRKNKEANDNDDVKKMTLCANSGIECYHCGQKGHKKNNCPKLQNQSGNNQGNDKGKGKSKSKGNCNYCGNPGHEEADCWQKHPDMKPEKYQKNDASSTNVDILVANIEEL